MSVTILIVLFVIAIDLVVIAIVFRRYLPLIQLSRSKRQTIVQATNELVGSQLRGTWNGDPATLQANLEAIVPRVQDLIRAQGLEPSSFVVRTLLTQSIREHNLAPVDQVRRALARLT
jgi:hypothetical protein